MRPGTTLWKNEDLCSSGLPTQANTNTACITYNFITTEYNCQRTLICVTSRLSSLKNIDITQYKKIPTYIMQKSTNCKKTPATLSLTPVTN